MCVYPCLCILYVGLYILIYVSPCTNKYLSHIQLMNLDTVYQKKYTYTNLQLLHYSKNILKI